MGAEGRGRPSFAPPQGDEIAVNHSRNDEDDRSRRAAPAWPRETSTSLLARAGLAVPPRLVLAKLPTRVQRLSRLSEELGIELWVKRDDETGTELSGNKVRKLEYLLAQAQARQADVVLTCGGVQSNHCRATALAARRLGMDSVLFLRGAEPPTTTGNLFLDRLVGADVRYITPEQYATRAALLPTVAEGLRAKGRRPYVIPEGGSNALGSWGYVQLVAELATAGVGESAPGPAWDHVVCATGSGGTLAGLVLGRRLLTPSVPWLGSTRMWGVPVCDDGAYFQKKVLEIAEEFRETFAPGAGASRTAPRVAPADCGSSGEGSLSEALLALGADEIGVFDGYKGPAYAVPYAEEMDLLRQVAREDGLLLDPVYTGKALYGLVREAQNGRFRSGERVLFLHTGGIFSLFAYADAILA